MTNKAGMEEGILAAANLTVLEKISKSRSRSVYQSDLDALEDLEIEDYDSDEDDEVYTRK